MHDKLTSTVEEEWIIWNGANGLVTTVTINRIEDSKNGKIAWLEEPFDMAGPFSFDELKADGRISFAACLIMSHQRWQNDRVQLQRESFDKRYAEQKRINEKYTHYASGHNGHQNKHKSFDEQQFRETLQLPVDSKLESSQINAAFRRLAQKVHPDVGGSHKQFVRITEARNVLLDYISSAN